MFLLGDQVVFSPTDLTNAVACEFAVLRGLDAKLGLTPALDRVQDAMLDRTATLGDAHELRVLTLLKAKYGAYDPARHSGVFTVERPKPGHLAGAAQQTLDILRSGADVVFQAAFLRGRFNGFADFIVRQDDGAYAVYDSKLARHAKVSALLQLAAYGDELLANAIAVAPQVHLILGDESISSHDLHDIIPVYRERRARLEAIVDAHIAGGTALEWNDPRVLACGHCDTCAAEVAAHRDLLLVAGLRTSQRTRLIEGGVHTIDQLAARAITVDGLRSRTFDSLRAQAAMQVQQSRPEVEAEGPVIADIFDPSALALIPARDPGDIFFDFEGDPLWSDGDPTRSGLEYLFGVVEVGTGQPAFRPFWAHNRAEEKQALQDFLAYVVERRTRFPGLHIYHYAAYEKSALLRLSGRYGVGETTVDDLLRDGVLVDLYSVVRNAVRVSQPSYSLKKLEPLYMGDQLRESDVKNAGDSIVAYADFCALRDDGQAEAAEALRVEIADYNEYDCLSTLRLRDWLIDRAVEHGIEAAPFIAAPDIEAPDDGDGVLVGRLLGFVGAAIASDRTAEQQAIALLAAAIGYHQREMKPFWWAHFDRLINPVDDWADLGDVLIVDEAEVESGWGRTGRQRNDRRTLRLAGRLGVGSQLGPGDKVSAAYAADSVPIGIQSDPGRRGIVTSVVILTRRIDDAGRDEVTVVESAPTGVTAWPELPMALVPGQPIQYGNLHAAIVTLGSSVADRLATGEDPSDGLADHAALQLLARQAPRLRGAKSLPVVRNDDYIATLTDAVRRLDDSYLAVQGPPGSGKTHVGAHVIEALVAGGWRIGVVAQSHKVVENLLAAIRRAGVPANQVGKKPGAGHPPDPRWTALADATFPTFLNDRADDGCVVGGTAWDFTNRNRVAVGSLDLLVIDEAGQFSLANTVAVSTAARNLLLLGDPQQLPQVSQGTHPEPCDSSALSWVIDGRPVMPADRGYFLARTWRMHPALTSAVSRLAYDGELHSNDAVTAARAVAGVEPGIHVLEVDHAGNSVESAEEADAVVRSVADLLGRTWTDPQTTGGPRPLDQRDVLVVAPYNAQVSLIRRRLDHAGYHDIAVGSVDRFQGQEAPVVIVSMTASAPQDVPRGMDFLLSRNRVNVAISRGQWCAIIIRSPRLTDYLPTHPAGLSRLGAFIGLCSAPVGTRHSSHLLEKS